MGQQVRCRWAGSDPLYIRYHDLEWGTPCWDDRRLFEFLVLEGAQAGLSWITILKKRSNYRVAFSGFDPSRVARYDKRKIEELLSNGGIIRNRAKIEAAVNNAKAFLAVQDEFGSFHAYIWRFVDFRPINNAWKRIEDIPSSSRESIAMSKELKKRGFRFVGPVICYSYMQAVGMVNDHTTDCFRYRELLQAADPPLPRGK